MPITGSVCLCFQSEHHLGLPAQTAAHRLVFSHSDAGAWEAGEGRPQEPGTHHRQREGRRCQQCPENALQTLQLLHREWAPFDSISRGWAQSSNEVMTLCSHVVFQICRAEDKFNSLVTFLRQHKHEKNLVFFRYVKPCRHVFYESLHITF